MSTNTIANLQSLYVAYFNRPADPAGLAFWKSAVDEQGVSLDEVAKSFASAAEYKDVYAGMSNGEVVSAVYQNLFGRAAEPAGKAFWVDALDKGVLTMDKVVTSIFSAAQGTDKVAVANKVVAATTFTDALDTPAEQAGYVGKEALAVAKSFISGVTTDASLKSAISATALESMVSKAVAAGTPFDLVAGLKSIDSAIEAKTNFLASVDGDGDAKTSVLESAIADKVDSTTAALDLLVEGNYTNGSATVRTALLADQMQAHYTKLTEDQKAVVDAQTAISKVAGLAAAAATLEGASTAAEKAIESSKLTTADLAAKLAAYNSLNGTSITVAADGSVTNLITINPETKALVLVKDVTEKTNPGITELLKSSVANEMADKVKTSAASAEGAAQLVVDGLDLTAGATAKLKEVAEAMTVVKLKDGVMPTAAQITTELATLDGVAKAAKVIADQSGSTPEQQAASTAAELAYGNFKTLTDEFAAADNANPLVKALTDAKAAVKAGGESIEALVKAVGEASEAVLHADQLKVLNETIKYAQDAFVANDMLAPVELTGAKFGTAGSDIFVAGTADGTITNFGLLGKDTLFLGTDVVFNEGKLSTGDNGVFEAFVSQVGADTVIKLETSEFGSNAANPELVTITLVGV